MNLAAAHRRHGQRTLLIDLDPQNGGASHHLGVDENRSDPETDNLVRHLIDRPTGEFDDLIHEATHGIHVIPSHNMLDSLETNLQRAQEMEQDMGGRFVKELQLQNVLRDAGVPEKYDVVIIDPPVTGGQHVYNAVSATGNIVIPLELSPKGEQSLYGSNCTDPLTEWNDRSTQHCQTSSSRPIRRHNRAILLVVTTADLMGTTGAQLG